MSKWIDFKELRRQLSFVEVLNLYGVEAKLKGEQATAVCPLPGHEHDGKKTSPSFSANVSRGIFQCFGCKARGNIFDFAVLMENGSPKNVSDVRNVAMKLAEKFGYGASERISRAPKSSAKAKRHRSQENAPPRKAVVVNQPIDFELKDLDVEHHISRTAASSPTRSSGSAWASAHAVS